MNELATFRLWQLISPALPVGAYAYSGGLEAAIEHSAVTDLESCEDWLTGLVEHALTYVDLPLFVRLYDAWDRQDIEAVDALNLQLQAMRETRELLAEDRQMGLALRRLLIDLDVQLAVQIDKPSFACMYALACQHWAIAKAAGAQGLCWSWVENQVAAAIKLIPLGQTDGQRLLGRMIPTMERALSVAMTVDDSALGCSLPGMALLSAGHEHQYSRLFRS